MLNRTDGVGTRRTPWVVLAVLAAVPALAPAASAQRRSSRPDAPVLAIEVGVVHPVAGPAIENGVILLRGTRIAAVGKAGQIEIPADAVRVSYPEAHAYPGLVDALSTAFLGKADESVDAGVEIADGLDAFEKDSIGLVEAGVTTAYVTNRSDSQWRGVGCVIRPRQGGFRVFPDHRAAAAALRMTSGPGPTHALQRSQQLEGYERLFDGLEAYSKSFEEFEKKKAEYDAAFEKYLEYHRKKKEGAAGAGADAKDKPADAPAGDARPEGARGEGNARPDGGRPAEGESERGGRGGARPPGAGGRGGRLRPPEGGAAPAAEGEARRGGEAGGAAVAGDKPPERPKYPKPPTREPLKDTLRKVKDGELALRIEAQRADEIVAALELARREELASVVIEQALGAASVADRVAAAGVGVVVTEIRAPERSTLVEAGHDGVPAITRLAAAGVPVAIGSGSPHRARHLPLLAAEACGAGLDRDVAVRAITLTAAELLGVQKQVGSLEPDKLADILITSGPLLDSGTRVLRVMASGRTEYEAR